MSPQNGQNSQGSFHNYWNSDGHADRQAPPWAKIRSEMRNNFPSYHADGKDSFAQEVTEAIQQLNTLRPHQGGPACLGDELPHSDFAKLTEGKTQKRHDLRSVVEDSVELFHGMPNWAHPSSMLNVIPPPNKAAIITMLMADIVKPNIIASETVRNAAKAETESAAMIARLLGWNESEAGGVYTFGGTGCILYALKYAITQVFGAETRSNGIREDGKVFISRQGHYANTTASDWAGLGTKNVISIKTDEETNEMDLKDLEENMAYYHNIGTPIVCVICTMGTTDAFAIDNVKKVRALTEKYPNDASKYGRTFVYCDAVIGWSWLFFRNYDFSANRLGFGDNVLDQIIGNYNMIKMASHADAIGMDFHKAAWVPYICSMFLMKDIKHFGSLMGRHGSPYITSGTDYHPGAYTLETSRSAASAMAGWATLKYFGHEGFQCMLGGILEIQNYFHYLISKEKTMVIVNKKNTGFTSLFRVYPHGTEAEAQYKLELENPDAQEDLKNSNAFQKRIVNFIWAWCRSGEKKNGLYGPNPGYTSGFRTTKYNDDMKDSNAVICALKCFSFNANVTSQTMHDLVAAVKLARDEVFTKGCVNGKR